jgi:hypothetical protein
VSKTKTVNTIPLFWFPANPNDYWLASLDFWRDEAEDGYTEDDGEPIQPQRLPEGG